MNKREYQFSMIESRTIVTTALVFIGRVLNSSYPREDLDWSVCVNLMIAYWDENNVNFQLLYHQERKGFIDYLVDELFGFVKYYLKKDL